MPSLNDQENDEEEEPFGTAPLPVALTGNPMKVSIGWEELIGSCTKVQQPQASPIAGFDALPNPNDAMGIGGSHSIEANRHFVLYAVKKGLVRVLHKGGIDLRHLLRGHSGQTLRDLQFFQDGDILGSVASSPESSRLLVWRILERSPEIQADILLEIAASSSSIQIFRMAWHPFNPNQFFMVHTDSQGTRVATLVESTRIKTRMSGAEGAAAAASSPPGTSPPPPPHAVCEFWSPTVLVEGSVQLSYYPQLNDGGSSNNNNNEPQDLTDLCWSDRDPRHVLTTFRTAIVLWDLKQTSSSSSSPPPPSSSPPPFGMMGGKHPRPDAGTVLPTRLAVIDTSQMPYSAALGSSFSNNIINTGLSRCFFVPYDDRASSPPHNTAAAASRGGEANAPPSTAGSPWTSCFVTGSDRNSTLTLWGPPSSASSAVIIQVIEVERSGSSSSSHINDSTQGLLVDGCFGPSGVGASPPHGFLLLADPTQPSLLALHCKSVWGHGDDDEIPRPLLAGCDYVVPFDLKEPIYSMKCVSVPAVDISDDDDEGVEDIDEEDADEDDCASGIRGGGGRRRGGGGALFDMKVYAYQARNTHCLTLTSYMCLPPVHTYVDPTPGVRMAKLLDAPPSAHVSDVDEDEMMGATPEIQYDEEYDVGVVDGDGDEGLVVEAPEASASPAPQGIFSPPPGSSGAATNASGTSSLASNPFANWLGAIAVKGTPDSSQIPFPTTSAAPPSIPSPAPSASKIPVSPPLPLLPAALGSIPFAEPSESPMPPPPDAPAPATQLPQALLSPLDIMGLNLDSSSASAPTNNAVVPEGTATPARTAPAPSKKENKASTGASSRLKHTDKGRGGAATAKTAPSPSILSRPAPPPKPLPTAAEAASSPASPLDDARIRAIIREELLGLVPEIRDVVRLAVAPIEGSLDRVATMQEKARDSILAKYNEQENRTSSSTAAAPVVDAEALAEAVDAPLRAAVASHVRGTWIPALESLTSRVLSQVSSHLQQQDNTRREEARKEEHRAKEGASGDRQQMETLSKQLSAVTEIVTQLKSEVQALRSSVTSNQQAQHVIASQQAQQPLLPPPPSSTSSASLPSPAAATSSLSAGVSDPTTRAQILAMLQARQYERAFTLAVTTTSSGSVGGEGISTAIFCCSQAPDDARTVLYQLSQPILLCLMQQLGTSLVVPATAKPDVSIELTWLQEIAMALDPGNSQIRAHVPGVVRQLLTGINARMGRDDPRYREPLRRLLQVVRGMQVG